MKKRIGIIGSTGRVGSILKQAIIKNNNYELGKDFSSDKEYNLEDVFLENDFLIDFSSSKLIRNIFSELLKNPRPIALCTTGWNQADYKEELDILRKKIPIVISPNTSLGANIQHYLVSTLSKILDNDYDIDITEKHHRNKIDLPSGTALSLINTIKKVKKDCFDIDYNAKSIDQGPRPDHLIEICVNRSGNLPGEHEVVFTNSSESISIKHTAFSRDLFVSGAIKIIEWMDLKPKPGLYSMLDVLNLTDINNKHAK